MTNLFEEKDALTSGEAKNIKEPMVKTYSKEEVDRIAEIGIQALRATKIVHDQLGKDGLTPVPSPNQFNEQALKADVEAEKTVLKSLRESGLSIRVVSEEHGTTDLVKNPDLLGILDGIDGTSQYIKGRGELLYGSMLSLASEVDPKYSDYLFSGIMIHSTNQLLIGIKGQGSFLVDPDGNRTQINTSGKTVFDDSTRIYSMSPAYNDTARKHLSGLVEKFKTEQPLSEAVALADVASGQADLVVETTRKHNLEQMIAFGLIIEAGGVMVDINDKSIANQRFLEWGQKDSLLLVTAATRELASDFLEKLKGI